MMQATNHRFPLSHVIPPNESNPFCKKEGRAASFAPIILSTAKEIILGFKRSNKDTRQENRINATKYLLDPFR